MWSVYIKGKEERHQAVAKLAEKTAAQARAEQLKSRYRVDYVVKEESDAEKTAIEA